MKCKLHAKHKMREKGHEVREMSVGWEMSRGKREKGGWVRSEGKIPRAYPWQWREADGEVVF